MMRCVFPVTIAAILASSGSSRAETDATFAIGAVYESERPDNPIAAEIRGGLLKKRSYSAKSPADGDVILTVLTFGVAAIPYDVWLGNLRGAGAAVRLGFDRLSVGVGVDLLVRRPESIFRTPSILGIIAPEVGVTLRDGDATGVYLRPFRVPIAAAIDDNTAVELSFGTELAFFADRPTTGQLVLGIAVVTP